MSVELNKTEAVLCLAGLIVIQAMEHVEPEPPAVEILVSKLEDFIKLSR